MNLMTRSTIDNCFGRLEKTLHLKSNQACIVSINNPGNCVLPWANYLSTHLNELVFYYPLLWRGCKHQTVWRVPNLTSALYVCLLWKHNKGIRNIKGLLTIYLLQLYKWTHCPTDGHKKIRGKEIQSIL